MNAHAVGHRIKAAREANGLMQEKLATLVDLSPTHISVIERGLKIPNLDSFVAIANALDVSTDSLLLDVVVRASKRFWYGYKPLLLGQRLKVLGRTLFNLGAFSLSKLKWAGSHFRAFPP